MTDITTLTSIPAPVMPHMTMADVARAYWPILVVSVGTSLVMTPLCRAFALRRRIVDRPDDFLKPHGRPIPYLGGVAIFAGWAAGIVAALLLYPKVADLTPGISGQPSVNARTLWAILFAGAAITLLGLTDDLRILSPRVKLAGNVLAALLLIWCGIGDDTVSFVVNSLRGPAGQYPRGLILIYSIPTSLFIIVGACNATNLIDGMDGLCSGVLGIISLGFLVLAAHLHIYGDWLPTDVHRVVLALAMLGGALGFLPYNRNPATIFMGDAGSMLLGLNAAVMLLLFAKVQNLRWVLGSVMVFGLPIADMLLTLARRWRAQRPLMAGDRSHFYDQLFDRGLSVRRVVGISYALATGFALLGCVSIVIRTRYVVLLYAAAALLVLWAVARFRMCRISDEGGA